MAKIFLLYIFQYLKGACLKTITYYLPTKSDTTLLLAQFSPMSKEEMDSYYQELKECVNRLNFWKRVIIFLRMTMSSLSGVDSKKFTSICPNEESV
jgi:hypothetical protein